MAAPDSTIWGKAASDYEGHEAKMGLAISIVNTASKSTVTIDVWFWSEYSVLDSRNTLYFDNEKTTATTSKGNVSIDTKVNSPGWTVNNQVLLGTYTYSYTRGSSDVTKNCAAKLDTIEAIDKNPISVTASYTIPKLSTFTIVYNANGGTGTMENTVVTYGESTNTSVCTFKRTGYTFKGWNAHRSSDNKWRYTNGADDTDAWYVEGSQPNGYSLFTYANECIVSTISSVGGDMITFYAIWEELSPQSVYIYLEDGTIYARAFIVSDVISIDNTGAVYAPTFITDTFFSISSTGITATNFIEGTPE